MAQTQTSWNPLHWFTGKGPKQAKPKPKNLLALELLEGREVPATLLVTNLYDYTNQQTPWPGSLREAVALSKPGDVIEFDSKLFESGSQQTLTLNGAVGYLNLVQNNVSIVGPGIFTTGTNSGQYQLLIQADTGIASISISSGGSGYSVGDILRQGATLESGGAEFLVQAVDSAGGITQATVTLAGANSTLATGTILNYTNPSGVTNLSTYTGSGTGAALRITSKGLASNIIWSQQIASANQAFTLSGIQFGNSAGSAIMQNLGNLNIDNCLFDFAASSFITSAGGAGSLTITNCTFDGANVQVNMGGAGPTTVINSVFKNSALGAALIGGGSKVTISDSTFANGTSGVITSTPTLTISESNFTNISSGALTIQGSNATITNSFFSGNQRGAGIQINSTSYGDTRNANKGGAAIFAYGGANLNISKSVFEKNTIGDPSKQNSGINVFNSGGGAIFNYSGQLTLDQCGFTQNSIAITHYPFLEPFDNQTDFAENPELMPSAANSGGGAVFSGGPTTITNSYFNDNRLYSQVDYWAYTKMPDTPPPPDSKPQYAGGGALYLTSNSGQANVVLQNVTISNNTVEQVASIPNKYVGTQVRELTAADFNQDGRGDLAIATSQTNQNIQVQLGTTGFNPFASSSPILTGGTAITALTTGDFNGDGWADLASSSGTTVSVFLNRGQLNGTWLGFGTRNNYTFTGTITSLASGRLNNDLRDDLVAGTSVGVSVALASSTGAFSSPTSYSLGTKAVGIALGDLNGDGRIDIGAALTTANNNVRTLINNQNNPGQFLTGGSGTAGGDPTANPPVAAPPLTAIAIGKNSGAGSAILVTNAETADNTFLFNNVNASTGFTYTSKFTAGSVANTIVAGDFNRDGNDDFAITQGNDSDNLQVGLADGIGGLTFTPYTAGAKPGSITTIEMNSGSGLIDIVAGVPANSKNLHLANNNGNGVFTVSQLTSVGTISNGAGLNGGAMIIAAGVNSDTLNAVQERAFTGTTNATLTNVTVVYNQLINPAAITGSPVQNSNVRTVQYSGGSWANQTDTGGVFNNTGSGSSIGTLNTILMNNTGISYVGPFGFDGVGRVATSNTGSRFSAGGPGSFGSSGYSMYSSTFGFSGGGVGNLTTLLSPQFDGGLRNNLGPTIGLNSPNVALPNNGQANLLTIALDRFSPGRDAGNSTVYDPPTNLKVDERNVNRFINLAVDMGAYEVQTATATNVKSPTLSPANPPSYPNPYFTATYGVEFPIISSVMPNDNKTPTGSIGGTVYLVNADNTALVYAVSPVTPVDPNDLTKGGTAALLINSNQKVNTVLPKIYPVNATFNIGPAGQTQTLVFAKNIALSTGDKLRFVPVNGQSGEFQEGTVISYNPESGLLAFTKGISNPASSQTAYSSWNVTLESANQFTLAANGATQNIWIPTGATNLAKGQAIRLYPLDANGNPIANNSNYQVGTITNYNPNTGVLSFTQTSFTGSGSYANWSVTINPVPPSKNNYMLVYSGDPNYALSQSNVFTIEVAANSTATTISTGSPSSQTPNTPVTFTGKVTANNSGLVPIGSVALQRQPVGGGAWTTFTSNTTIDSGGNYSISATFPSTPAPNPQNWNIRAVYSPTSAAATQFQTSTSNSVVEEVGYKLTSFNVAAFNPAAIQRGASATFSATINFNSAQGTPSGNVSFYATNNGGSPILVGTFPKTSSTASSQTFSATVDPRMLPFGVNSVYATYNRAANDTFLPATSTNTTPLTINPIQSTVNLVPVSTTGSYGEVIAFGVTIDPATVPYNSSSPGTVTFYSGGNIIASTPSFPNPAPVTLNNQGFPNPVSYSTNQLLPGTNKITAVYSGDGLNYSGDTSGEVAIQISQASTTTALIAPDQVVVPATFDLVANITTATTDPASPPDGTVTFRLNGQDLAIVSLTSSGQKSSTAKLRYTASKVGELNFQAVYSGNQNYTGSQIAKTVKATIGTSTTTTLTASTTNTPYGTPITFTARVGPSGGLPYSAGTLVTFNNASVQNITNQPVSLLPATIPPQIQSVTLAANQDITLDKPIRLIALDDAGQPRLVDPAKPANTSNFVSQFGIVSAYNPNTGLLTFQNTGFQGVEGSTYSKWQVISVLGQDLGAVPLALDGSGWPLPVQLSDSSLNTGNYNVFASFPGDSNYNSSYSNPLPVVISKSSTSLSLTPSNPSINLGSKVTLTAKLTNNAQSPATKPSGDINYYLGSNPASWVLIGTASLSTNGIAQLDYTPTAGGNLVFSAVYNGQTNYTASTASTQVSVASQTQTAVSLAASSNSSVFGSEVTFTASVSPNGPPAYLGGTIEFWANGSKLNTQTLPLNAQGNPLPVTFSTNALAAGTAQVTAIYSGDGSKYAGSTSPAVNVTVNKAGSTLTLNSSATRIEAGGTITLSAAVGTTISNPPSQPSGTVDFYFSGTKIGSSPLVNGTATLPGVVTPITIGSYTYEAKYGGNTNYNGSVNTATVSTFKRTQENFYLVAPQQGSILQVYNRATNKQEAVLQPMGAGYKNGFTLAKGDVNNDGVEDLLYAPRNGGQVVILDGKNYSTIGALYPFGQNFGAPLSIAVGDVNNDGFGDIIAAPGGVGLAPRVVAISGKDFNKTLFSQFAYSTQFLGGVSVASGDVNGDGTSDIITAPLAGAPPHIVSFNVITGKVLQSYYAYDPRYMGGTSIAAADLNNDGFAEIITAASASAPHVVVVDSKLAMQYPADPAKFVKASFYAYAPTFGGGVRVSTVQDLNNDGIDDVITSPGPGAGPNVVRFDGKLLLQNKVKVIDSFFAFGTSDPAANYYGGTFVG